MTTNNPYAKDVILFLAAIVVSMSGVWMMTGKNLINRDEARVLVQQQTIAMETKLELYYKALLEQEDRIARQEEGGGLLSRIFGSGEITDDTRYAMRDRNTLLSNLAARAGPRNPYTSLATRGRNKSLERTTSRGDDEREANIAASYAAHRRVHYAEGGPADLDVLLDDLKIAYDSLSPEEESELLRMIE